MYKVVISDNISIEGEGWRNTGAKFLHIIDIKLALI